MASEQASGIIDLTSNNFDKIIEENELVLVDFWAPWCGPCRNFGLTYQEVAKQVAAQEGEASTKIVFAKINVEEEQKLTADFNVQKIPHLMIVKNSIVIYSEAASILASDLKALILKAQETDIEKLSVQIKEIEEKK